MYSSFILFFSKPRMIAIIQIIQISQCRIDIIQIGYIQNLQSLADKFICGFIKRTYPDLGFLDDITLLHHSSRKGIQ